MGRLPLLALVAAAAAAVVVVVVVMVVVAAAGLNPLMPAHHASHTLHSSLTSSFHFFVFLISLLTTHSMGIIIPSPGSCAARTPRLGQVNSRIGDAGLAPTPAAASRPANDIPVTGVMTVISEPEVRGVGRRWAASSRGDHSSPDADQEGRCFLQLTPHRPQSRPGIRHITGAEARAITENPSKIYKKCILTLFSFEIFPWSGPRQPYVHFLWLCGRKPTTSRRVGVRLGICLRSCTHRHSLPN
ncbi:hypothetical protein E2C01_088151 [Portunus trituberculatus]|uniref:Uncharacterized protein n=1 Tax=Portunus trituberculatus TaxID=210409 RepID=A0A5B7JFX0_PORTR|nr:hypothetical protein [Portunus trituberculatus]